MKLVLIAGQEPRLRCRHCHLTIKAKDVEGAYCPECYEAFGRKRYDFDKVKAEKTDEPRYRCEECGVLIE